MSRNRLGPFFFSFGRFSVSEIKVPTLDGARLRDLLDARLGAWLGPRLGALLRDLLGAMLGALERDELRPKKPLGASEGALDLRSCRSDRSDRPDGACEGAWVGALVDRERRERREEATDTSSSNLNRGSRCSRALAMSMPDIAAAVGVMNSPSTEVPTLSACSSATPRLHISTELSASVLNSISSSISASCWGGAGSPASSTASVPPLIRWMILYPPNMTTVAPKPTPAAIRN